ncbi:MAG TPA: hypothetical protein VIL65_12440 [Beijerinckiaceae bacterium]
MASNVENATLEILKSIQTGVTDMKRDLSELKADMNARFGSIDEQLRKQRRNGAGMLVMMQATAGAFDEPVKDIEKRVQALESRAI